LAEIITRYQLKEEIEQQTLNQFLYEAETKKLKPCLIGYRELSQKYSIKIDRKEPVVLADNIKGKPFYFNFLNPVEGKKYAINFRK